jgi:hypothetical protein
MSDLSLQLFAATGPGHAECVREASYAAGPPLTRRVAHAST